MAGSVIKIEGLDKTLARFDVKKYEPEIQQCFDKFGLRVELMAKQNVVVDEGRLKTSIFQQPGKLSSTVGASADYAAYVEFGTGRFAAKYVTRLPKEWKELAMSFYVNGKGRLPAHPYLYPAFNKAKDMLIKDLQGLTFKSTGFTKQSIPRRSFR